MNVNQSDKNKESQKNLNTTINPYTEEIIESYSFDTEEQSKEKLEAAHRAFIKWSEKELSERMVPINKFADLLEVNRDEFATLMVSEMGKTFIQAQGEVDRCVGIIRYSTKHAPEFLKDEEKEYSNGKALTTYSPQGVILGIQPWNFPLYQAIRYSIPNLLAGNTTLLKHARNVWGCAFKIRELLLKAGLPDGAFNVLKIKSKDMDFLYKSQKVRGVTFTGSSSVGRKIAQKAGENLKKTVLELGGNDAYIVLKGANLDSAVESCVQGRMNNNGQTCVSAKRFLIEAPIYEEFKDKFLSKMKEAQMGDPMEKTTKLGPMAREDLLEKLNEQVEESLEKGATCLLGGNIEKRKGYFFAATVLENLSPGMPAYDDELFGPVASLIKVKDLDEAISISNSSIYGLGGGIFGANEEQLISIAKNKLDTGMVNINGYGAAEANLPFGGVKDSGYGREFSNNGFHEFVNIKTIMIHENNK